MTFFSLFLEIYKSFLKSLINPVYFVFRALFFRAFYIFSRFSFRFIWFWFNIQKGWFIPLISFYFLHVIQRFWSSSLKKPLLRFYFYIRFFSCCYSLSKVISSIKSIFFWFFWFFWYKSFFEKSLGFLSIQNFLKYLIFFL